MKLFLIALIGSILTAIYWWGVVTVSYGLFGGSRNPALAPPSEATLMLQNVGTIVVAIVLYALLSMLWSRLLAKQR